MNDQPMTRRAGVALLGYTTLVLNVVQWLLSMAHEFVVTRFLPAPIPLPAHLIVLVCEAVSLFFWPFIPLMSSLVEGKIYPVSSLPQRIAFIARCVGFMLFLATFPNFLNSLFYAVENLTWKTPGTLRWLLLYSLSEPLFFLSLGFALAFFPAIFSSLRHRLRDEPNENAA